MNILIPNYEVTLANFIDVDGVQIEFNREISMWSFVPGDWILNCESSQN